MLELHKLVKRVNNHFNIRELLKLHYHNDLLARILLRWFSRAKFISYECATPAEIMEAFPLWPDQPAVKEVLRNGERVLIEIPKETVPYIDESVPIGYMRLIEGNHRFGYTDRQFIRTKGSIEYTSKIYYLIRGNTLTIANKLTNQVIVVSRVV